MIWSVAGSHRRNRCAVTKPPTPPPQIRIWLIRSFISLLYPSVHDHLVRPQCPVRQLLHGAPVHIGNERIVAHRSRVHTGSTNAHNGALSLGNCHHAFQIVIIGLRSFGIHRLNSDDQRHGGPIHHSGGRLTTKTQTDEPLSPFWRYPHGLQGLGAPALVAVTG